MKIHTYWKISSIALLFVLSIIFCFVKLNNRMLERWDEYTNFSVVYDTIHSDDELILKNNGQPFLEKPPLWYYLAIASTKVFGLNFFALRFVSALSGVLLILLVFYMGWKMFSFTSGIIAGFSLLATSHLFIPDLGGLYSSHTLRSADLDALQLLFIMLSTFCFYKIQKQPKKWLFWTTLSSIYTAFGFLTKGPFALLPSLLFFSYIVIQNYLDKKNNAKAVFNWRQIVIIYITFIGQFILLTLPWHILMYKQYGKEFLSSYIGYHILERGFTTIEEHYGKFYYYIRILLDVRFGFLGLATIISVILTIKKFGKEILCSFPLYANFGGVLVIFIIITMIQTKLAWYIFYLYPFGALITGYIIQRVLHSLNTTLSKILIISPIILFLLVNAYHILSLYNTSP